MSFQTSLVLFIPPFSSLLYFPPYPSPVQVPPHCLFSHFHLRSTCSLLFSPLASPSTTVCFYFLFPVVTLGYRFTPENFELESTNKKEHVAFAFLHLGYHTEDNNFQFHPFTCKFHDFVYKCTIQITTLIERGDRKKAFCLFVCLFF